MSMNDPIADMLTRIRNAARAGKPTATVPFSKMKESVARVLYAEGFLNNVEVLGEGVRKNIVLEMKYTPEGESVILNLKRVSTPGCRVYISQKDMKPMRQGTGIAILSTPKGILKDTDAKRRGVGGEVLCTVW